MTISKTYLLESLTLDESQWLFGQNDQHLTLLKQVFNCDFVVRDNQLIVLSGTREHQNALYATFKALIHQLRQTSHLDERDVIYLAQCELNNQNIDLHTYTNSVLARTYSGKPIYAKTAGQHQLIEALKASELVLCVGPAGTGKTYLSVIYAVSLLKKGEVKKIILTRPVVEAGENLGFLPGDLKEKIDPYLRPLYDALNDVLGLEQVDKMIEKGVIEIAPLAYMRGRTFEDAFVILDEAQNTTRSQMLMFLTRMGFRTRMVVTGDETQVDLKQSSGLTHAVQTLNAIKELRFVQLTKLDVVRHPLVQKIIEAYEKT